MNGFVVRLGRYRFVYATRDRLEVAWQDYTDDPQAALRRMINGSINREILNPESRTESLEARTPERGNLPGNVGVYTEPYGLGEPALRQEPTSEAETHQRACLTALESEIGNQGSRFGGENIPTRPMSDGEFRQSLRDRGLPHPEEAFPEPAVLNPRVNSQEFRRYLAGLGIPYPNIGEIWSEEVQEAWDRFNAVSAREPRESVAIHSLERPYRRVLEGAPVTTTGAATAAYPAPPTSGGEDVPF